MTLSSSKLIGMAPPAFAMSRRSGTRSIAITCLAPSRTALRIANCPTGPAPQIATVSVGSMSIARRPASRSENVAEEQHLLVTEPVGS